MTPCRHPACAICLPLCAERSIRASTLRELVIGSVIVAVVGGIAALWMCL